jgi:hypothetical protein
MAQRSATQYPTSGRGARTSGYVDDGDTHTIIASARQYKAPTIHNWGRWLAVGWLSLILMGVVQQWATPDALLYYETTAPASVASIGGATGLLVGLTMGSPGMVAMAGVTTFFATCMNGYSTRLAKDELSDCEDLHSDSQALARAQKAYKEGKAAIGAGNSYLLGAYVKAQEPQTNSGTRSGNVCAGVIFSAHTYKVYQAGIMLHAIGQLIIGALLCLGLLFDWKHLLRWMEGQREIEAKMYEIMVRLDDTGEFRKLLQRVAMEQEKLEHLSSS